MSACLKAAFSALQSAQIQRYPGRPVTRSEERTKHLSVCGQDLSYSVLNPPRIQNEKEKTTNYTQHAKCSEGATAQLRYSGCNLNSRSKGTSVSPSTFGSPHCLLLPVNSASASWSQEVSGEYSDETLPLLSYLFFPEKPVLHNP